MTSLGSHDPNTIEAVDAPTCCMDSLHREHSQTVGGVDIATPAAMSALVLAFEERVIGIAFAKRTEWHRPGVRDPPADMDLRRAQLEGPGYDGTCGHSWRSAGDSTAIFTGIDNGQQAPVCCGGL